MNQTIRRNILNNPTSFMSKGIYVAEPNYKIYATYLIADNKIYDTPFGIHTKNLRNPVIQNNEVTVMPNTIVEPPTHSYGILVENCISYSVVGNDVIGNTANMENDLLSVAYMIEFTAGLTMKKGAINFVSCNKSENIGHGFWFGGYTYKTRFVENLMYDSYYQFYLHYNKFGMGSLSPTSDNRWMTTPGFSNTFSNNSNDLSIQGHTTFQVKNSTTYLPSISSIDVVNSNVIGASICQAQTNTVYSEPICGGDPIETIIDEDVDDELRIAEADWTDNEEYEWISKYFLNSMVVSDTTGIFNDYEIILNIADSLEETNIALVYQITDALGRLPFDSSQQDAVNDILSLNSSLSPNLTIEEYIKDYNQIYLTTFALGDPVSQDQKTRLKTIADGCPYTDGPAVYSARVMISMIEPETVHTYSVCGGGSARIATNLKEFLSNNFTVYPNPASHFISFYPEIKENYAFKVFDYSGRLVLNQKDSKNTIDVSILNAGIYFYEIILNEKMFKGKFSIIK